VIAKKKGKEKNCDANADNDNGSSLSIVSGKKKENVKKIKVVNAVSKVLGVCVC